LLAMLQGLTVRAQILGTHQHDWRLSGDTTTIQPM